MFAYCRNNPVINKDAAGNTDTMAMQQTASWILALLAMLDAATPFLEATVLVLVGVAVVSAYIEREKEEVIVIADTAVASNDEQAIYYGADIVGNSTGKKEWRIQTGPMDYETAIAWTYATAASGKYGKNASWGLYTENQTDAQEMAVALGGAGPCLHENRPREYPHYHVYGMLLFGEYKHFHVWYGSVY